MLDGPDGDVAGEIDIDPNDTSLLEPEEAAEDGDGPPGVNTSVDDDVEPMAVDKTFVAPSDTDSAVGSDVRNSTDTSFQSTSSGGSGDGDIQSSETGGAFTANDSSLVTSTSAMDVHECVSLISDAVHVQSASTVGVVDTRLVSF